MFEDSATSLELLCEKLGQGWLNATAQMHAQFKRVMMNGQESLQTILKERNNGQLDGIFFSISSNDSFSNGFFP